MWGYSNPAFALALAVDFELALAVDVEVALALD
jgi:hypothetical protein